ncbi:MAG: hypothetical protein MJE77_14135, partial [Proteobacteria bacterium]|nr:hypothetical protein [Pseudomonadota bacterium]
MFDESTLEQSDNASRSITGDLYFDFDGFPFPAERWNDFVVVIIAWWLAALAAFGKNPERRYHYWAKPSGGLPPGAPCARNRLIAALGRDARRFG